MKIGIKENGIEVDADLEGMAGKIYEGHNKNWKSKTKIKHKNKMELKEWKKNNRKPGLFASKKEKEEYKRKQKIKERKPLFVFLCILGSVLLGFYANHLKEIYGCILFGIGCGLVAYSISNLDK